MFKNIFIFICAIAFLYIVTTASYPLVSRFVPLTSDEWHNASIISIPLIWLLIGKLSKLTVTRGEITGEGVHLVKKNTVIPFEKIERIISERYEVDEIHTAEGETAVRLREIEVVKLQKAGFTQWSISDKRAIIQRGTAGEEFSATYSATGKYYNRKVSFCLVVIPIIVFFILAYYNIGSMDIIFALPFSILIMMAYQDYKEVVITIERNGIKLKDENLAEHFMAFAEMGKVEKGWVRTKLTAKDGRALYLPQALYLLPEFIEEYARLRKA